jgi:predicted acyltransferase
MKQKPMQVVPRERLLSLDALRGFDMFWITGGGYLVTVLAKYSGAGWLQALADQMEHVPWNGFHFEDLIFPLFMFISGVAIPFALVSKLEKKVPKNELARKAFKRALTLVFLGLIYNGVFSNGFEHPRFASVLAQIGLAYLFAALIVIYTKSFKQRLYWLGGILAGIGIIQLLIPVPGIGAGVLTPEGCINGYIDRALLPGRLYGGPFDPEGLLCIVSAVTVTLMGSVAGHFLRDKKTNDKQKIKTLSLIGVSSIAVALLLSTFYPIIKACWTSSFNLLTGGIGFLLISLFYWIIDVKGWKKWAFFFRVIGMNSIFIYLLYDLVNIGNITKYVLGWTVFWGDFGQIVSIIGSIMLVWLLLYYMYKKGIFLRV